VEAGREESGKERGKEWWVKGVSLDVWVRSDVMKRWGMWR